MLALVRRQGRLRRRRHLLLLIPVALASWGWFGLTGTVPLVIWWWSRGSTARGGDWLLDPTRVRAARLGPWRTSIHLEGGQWLEIFNDELCPGDLAALRRTLKAQLAAGCSTSSRSEKPGNRIVSSERGRVSG